MSYNIDLGKKVNTPMNEMRNMIDIYYSQTEISKIKAINEAH